MIDKSKLYWYGNAEQVKVGMYGILFDNINDLEDILEDKTIKSKFICCCVEEVLSEDVECFTGDDGFRYTYFYLLDPDPAIVPYDKSDIDFLMGKKWLKLKDTDDLVLITELAVVNGELRINGKPAAVILSDYLLPDGGMCGKHRI